MRTKTAIDCPVCSFPIHESSIFIRCPFCGKESRLSEVAMRGRSQISSEVSGTIQGPGIGSGFLTLLIGFGVGTLIGPRLIATTREGAETLLEIAEEKLKEKRGK